MSQLLQSEHPPVYCLCPVCNVARKKVGKHWTIIRRGTERNGLSRYYCQNCKSWFNERTGESMRWLSR